jgi:hypothetical protein
LVAPEVLDSEPKVIPPSLVYTPSDLTSRPPWVWDYDIDEEQFRRLLAGEITLGRLDRTWAAVRLIEYGPYREIVRLIGFRELVKGWPEWRQHVRSESARRGLDFLVEWLPEHHPELL